MIQKNMVYGFVTRLPKNQNEAYWVTRGHDDYNPEGSFLYEFDDEVGWRQIVKTRLDLEFFKSRPNDYSVEVLQGADSRPRRPVREELKAEAPKVEAAKGKLDSSWTEKEFNYQDPNGIATSAVSDKTETSKDKPPKTKEPVAPEPAMPEEVKSAFPAKRMGRPPKN